MANELIWEGSPRDVEPGDYQCDTPHRVTADDSGTLSVEMKEEDKLGAARWVLLREGDLYAQVVTRAAIKKLVDHWLKAQAPSP